MVTLEQPRVSAESPVQRVVTSLQQALPALLLASSALVHLYLVFRFPLAPDETYYWEWSRNLAWGYYDQAPLIAWVIRASCTLFGETELGIRFPTVAASLVTALLTYRLAFDLFGRRVALAALVPTLITPIALAGSFVATYDPLLVLFWSAALWTLSRALFHQSRSAWIGCGVACGLGLLSKNTMALILPCVLLFLATSPEHRFWLRRWEPYAALLVAVVVYSPNLVWQYQNDWVTFKHLMILSEKGTDNAFLRRLGDFLGSQFMLLSPGLFIGAVGALRWSIARRGREHGDRLWFVLMTALPVLLFFTVMTLKSKVQANWAGTAFIGLFVIWGAWAVAASSRRRLAFWNKVALDFCFVLSLLMLWPEARRVVGMGLPARWDQMNKLYGGPELGAAVSLERDTMQGRTGKSVALGAATYDVASRMAFYTKGQPATVCLFLRTRANSYAAWNGKAGLQSGGDALLACDVTREDAVVPPFEMVFDRVERVSAPVTVYRRRVYREPVKIYALYRCYGYRPNPLIERPEGG